MVEATSLGRPANAAADADSLTQDLLRLQIFLSPAFPVGSFSYSHGLEWLIEAASLNTADEVQAWVTDLLEVGSGWNDAVLFAQAYRAAAELDQARLLAVAELAEALASSTERHLETMAQGRAFLAAVASAWPCPAVECLVGTGGACYPVAVGTASSAHAISLDQALPAYLNAFAANLVSAAVRLVPLGQTAGLKVIAALHPVIATVSARAVRSGLDDLGSAAILSDIASMRHEAQYSRVFRT
jgi:urease accessory protein